MKGIVEFKNYDLSPRSPIKFYNLPYEKLESKEEQNNFFFLQVIIYEQPSVYTQTISTM